MKRGFSLLEVMVAIAILGLVLTVILSAQGGLAASNRSASNMGQAVSLGRCKMTEVEEKLLKFGYPEIDAIDNDVPCCNEEKSEAFVCNTRVEKVEMPSFQSGNSLGDGGALIGPGGSASSPLMNNPLTSGALNLDGGLQGVGASLTQQFGGTGAGAEGLLSMVMGIIYPSIKPMFEMAIRRLTVTVKWKEGVNARELPLIQYVTNPARGGFAANALMPDGGTMDFGPAGSASPSGTGTSRPPTPGGTR